MTTPVGGNPVASIAGGASGIGRAFAQRQVGSGGKVVLLDLDPAALEWAAGELGGSDVARGIITDVTDDAPMQAAFGSIGEKEGRLGAAVNCAGIAKAAPSSGVSDADWVRLIDVHRNGTMRASSERGAIVNISSVAASSRMPGRASYCAFKAGIEGLTRTLGVEWAEHGIRCNAVGPGYTRTALTDSLTKEGKPDGTPLINRTPMRQLAEPSGIEAALNFLASTAASFITGQPLLADGGMTVDGNWY